MARGCARIIIVLTGMCCFASTARGGQSPAKPHDRVGDKASVMPGGADKTCSCPALTRIRFYPRKGFAQRMLKGRFSGSNGGKTTDCQTVAEVKEVPPEGQWTEIQLAKPVRFRYLKYESPMGGRGNVAEVKFYDGQQKIQGQPFGTTGSKDHLGNDFFAEIFADGIHLTPKGRYLISLVHYACIYKENPEGKVSALTTGLTPEQARIFQHIAWDAVKNYKWGGVTAPTE